LAEPARRLLAKHSTKTLFKDVKTIAIIGGGVSGALVATHLLKQAATPLRIVIIERTPPIGRGVAYGTDCPDHLLNVPAVRMGAFSDEPDHFYKWVAARVGRSTFPKTVATTDFLPRSLYGQYIYSVLMDARLTAAKGVVLETVVGEAVDIEEKPDGALVLLKDGRSIEAARVVLALGNLPGEYPIRKSSQFFHGRRYVHVPWTDGALEGINPADEILIVGAGLTAADIITQLSHRGHSGNIHALSRRGLKPQVQRLASPYRDFLANQSLPPTVGQTLRLVRNEVRLASSNGHDWQSVIDALRPHTATLWQNWPLPERARFLRHLRPFWEAHRHRFAAQTGAQLEALQATGQLQFYAGRLQSLSETATGAEATFRHRGTDKLTTLQVAKVINCTGPRSDYSKYQHPLFINLLARGLIDHDPLALGLNGNAEGDLFRYRGKPSGWLLALGAPLKGVLWECTAVAEIRIQARALSAKLIASLSGRVESAQSASPTPGSLSSFAGVSTPSQTKPTDMLLRPRAFFAAQ
jgi:uncharacterized NAD(P)/FAD-binding protein YdhS